jgi:hypothetical protein
MDSSPEWTPPGIRPNPSESDPPPNPSESRTVNPGSSLLHVAPPHHRGFGEVRRQAPERHLHRGHLGVAQREGLKSSFFRLDESSTFRLDVSAFIWNTSGGFFNHVSGENSTGGELEKWTS